MPNAQRARLENRRRAGISDVAQQRSPHALIISNFVALFILFCIVTERLSATL